MKQRLRSHIQSITDPALHQTCVGILAYGHFLTWPASLSFHHAYEGGLLAHTVEVCDIALRIAESASVTEMFEGCPTQRSSFDFARRDILLAAALFHDLMKIEEYERSETAAVSEIMWRHTDTYGKQIGHIIASATQFQVTAVNHGVSRATIDAVTHCILAHHGRKEWGSPVEPQTLEALILHQADMLSAKFGATKDSAPS